MKKATLDGNTAAAYVAYAFSEVAAVYPITPSSGMAELFEEWSVAGKKNMFGQTPKAVQMQSESGSAGALHGVLTAGALGVSFTASQGLLLMLPDLYKIAGELLPTVIHVAARTVATHALSIFGDHSDVMAARQTGVALLASSSVQEAADLAVVSHLSTLKASVPFIHFFDGFRTSHELTKVEIFDDKDGYAELKSLVKELFLDSQIEKFRARALNPEHPVARGTTQNPDIFFQNRESANGFYAALPETVEEIMNALYKRTGRRYKLFDYVGAQDAKHVVVAIGSACETLEEYLLTANGQGKKYGLIKVRLYRPFAANAFLSVLPKSVKKLTVLDRTKESGAIGEPLYLDVCAALREENRENIKVFGGRYGLASKEFNANTVRAIFENSERKAPKNHFTVGITEDVTMTSLPMPKTRVNASSVRLSCKFYGFGSDGTVSSVKSTAKLVGDQTTLYPQAYFVYDSKKSGGLTVSHLRFDDQPIKSEYLVDHADFIACHAPAYLDKYDMLSDLKKGGKFLLNYDKTTPKALSAALPARFKRELARKRAKLYVIDANAAAEKIGLGGKISLFLQTAFFLLNESIIPFESAKELLEERVKSAFFKKGEDVVKKNIEAVRLTKKLLKEIPVPKSWENAKEKKATAPTTKNEHWEKIAAPVLALQGNKLPASAFRPDGSVPTGTSGYEKRRAANYIPQWNSKKCIQCTTCALSCPHATIRAYIFENRENVPKSFSGKPAMQADGKLFRIQVFPYDCTGCGVCNEVCPVNKKADGQALKSGQRASVAERAINMVSAHENAEAEEQNSRFALTLPAFEPTENAKMSAVKRSQLSQPLFEFSGACAGCGETPYIKLVTQLFGDRMIIANATGCSSIYGGSAPTCPYTVNEKGHGPAWANSLFEDNAEFGLGIRLAYEARRNALKEKLRSLSEKLENQAEKNVIETWLKTADDGEESKRACVALLKCLETLGDDPLAREIYKNKDCLVKKSVWLIGGDGWAYDIGYGGLDHVIATGEDVNVLILDSEVYSNTGGQASKSTQLSAVAKLATNGKRIRKKDLGLIFTTYGYAYVAQCSMGANPNQLIKALQEADSYQGPSIVVCYSPCIAHGIEMKNSAAEQKRAVELGYWHLFRYDPLRRTRKENPFTLDSPPPTGKASDFMRGELRFASLQKTAPNEAEALYAQADEILKEKYERYKKLHDGVL